MKLKIKRLHPDVGLPKYGSENAGWMDLHAYLDSPVEVLGPGERAMITTGIASEIPRGYRVKFEGRSGLAAKQGIDVLGGCIDSDYRGEWKVILLNAGEHPVAIKNGDRICQFSLEEVIPIEIEEVKELETTARGVGGFGSTGQ